MSNKHENEELQSRREFFKKAAKAALPVVGAVVLSSLPLAQAKAQICDNCESFCTSGCYISCQGTCKKTCEYGCRTQAYA